MANTLWGTVVKHAFRLASASSFGLLLSACGGDFEGDAKNGQKIFESATCAGCHTPAADGAYGWTFPDESGSRTHLDDAVEDLAKYISDNMPDDQEEKCVGQCADDTAAFLKDYYKKWNAGEWGSSSSSSSSSSASSTSSSSSSSSSSSGFALTGTEIYHDNEIGCVGCHGDDGQGGTPLNLEDFSSQATLAGYIESSMPKSDPDACGKECAERVTGFIWAWREQESACTAGSEEPLPRQLRLLTPSEYQNTVNDLFGYAISVSSNFPSSDPVGGYDNNVQASAVSESHVSKYWDAAATLAFADQFNFKDFGWCNDGESANVCSERFLDNFGYKAFRRPLTAQEVSNYQSLWAKAGSNDQGARMVVQAMLMSPHFLYRPELGSNGKLTKYEIASLLSYTFLGSMPDSNLFDAAKYSNLDDAGTIRQQVERLLETDRAKARLAHFGRQWVGAETITQANKDGGVFPEFTEAVKQAMDTELDMFFADVFLDEGSKFADLYLADFVYANDVLANFYGLSGAGSQFSKIAAGSNRGGILELGGVLSTHAQFNQTSPIKRGVFVRERLLCQELPAPPPGLDADPPVLDLSKSTRERFAIHTDNDECASCHQFIDPIGFSFEKYDGVGRYRELENDIVVDDSGSLRGLVNRTDFDIHDYHGTGELSDMLANAPSAAACLAEQFHIFMSGHAHPDPCTVESTVQSWKSSDYLIKKLWVEAVSTSTFIERQ